MSVLTFDDTEIVLSTKIPLNYNTGVSVVIGNDASAGIVIACRPDQDNFTVIIQLMTSIHFPDNFEHDPGLLAVNDFMTEEQERKLLDEIEQEWRSSGDNARAAAN